MFNNSLGGFKQRFYAIYVIHVVASISQFNRRRVAPHDAHVPDAAGTMLLCTHRAAPSSQIKINVIPSNFVYALNMDGQACVQSFAESSPSA